MNINQLDLRQAIMYKMQGSTAGDVMDTINDAVTTGQEKTLPGLGVLFEVLWQHSDSAAKQQMAGTISQYIPSQASSPVGT
ncbi:small acid-soluble spore protein SspI [Brevibacillus sp. B_LB10_24]|uniref:small acid-soluble spore protein SspI n=1 Tax=Brevibacillus sp. B_LB10_24 TaxID=3380645 RepID=UPI0038B719CB